MFSYALQIREQSFAIPYLHLDRNQPLRGRGERQGRPVRDRGSGHGGGKGQRVRSRRDRDLTSCPGCRGLLAGRLLRGRGRATASSRLRRSKYKAPIASRTTPKPPITHGNQRPKSGVPPLVVDGRTSDGPGTSESTEMSDVALE